MDNKENFKDLMKSNVRPKCVPTITIKNADANGEDIVFHAKNIKKISFKQSEDPLGRYLPYMELKWTEVYNGKLNAKGYPSIYENISAFCPVEITFEQKTDFRNYWKNIYDNGLSWRDIFLKGSWKKVREENDGFRKTFKWLYLSGRPVLNGNLIEWVAKDILHFMDAQESLYFEAGANAKNIFKNIAINACGSFQMNEEMCENIFSLDCDVLEEFNITKPIKISQQINDALKNFASTHNCYIRLEEGKIVVKKCEYNFEELESQYSFPLKLQYKFPLLQKNSIPSSYEFTSNYLENKSTYQMSKNSVDYAYYTGPYSNGLTDFYVFHYKYDNSFVEHSSFEADLNYAITAKPSRVIGENPESLQLNVMPVEQHTEEMKISLSKAGEPFVEKNELCYFDKNSVVISSRVDFIQKYFSDYGDTIDVVVAPNIDVVVGSVFDVETNFYENDQKIWKKVVCVENNIEYDGSIRQNIRSHAI